MKNTIEIPTGSRKILSEVLDKFNTTYRVNFKILSFEDRDGVEFGIIEITENTSNNMIFMFGFFWGAKVNLLRQKGEIDW